jgi:hypothetical protein
MGRVFQVHNRALEQPWISVTATVVSKSNSNKTERGTREVQKRILAALSRDYVTGVLFGTGEAKQQPLCND